MERRTLPRTFYQEIQLKNRGGGGATTGLTPGPAVMTMMTPGPSQLGAAGSPAQFGAGGSQWDAVVFLDFRTSYSTTSMPWALLPLPGGGGASGDTLAEHMLEQHKQCRLIVLTVRDEAPFRPLLAHLYHQGIVLWTMPCHVQHRLAAQLFYRAHPTLWTPHTLTMVWATNVVVEHPLLWRHLADQTDRLVFLGHKGAVQLATTWTATAWEAGADGGGATHVLNVPVWSMPDDYFTMVAAFMTTTTPPPADACAAVPLLPAPQEVEEAEGG